MAGAASVTVPLQRHSARRVHAPLGSGLLRLKSSTEEGPPRADRGVDRSYRETNGVGRSWLAGREMMNFDENNGRVSAKINTVTRYRRSPSGQDAGPSNFTAETAGEGCALSDRLRGRNGHTSAPETSGWGVVNTTIGE